WISAKVAGSRSCEDRARAPAVFVALIVDPPVVAGGNRSRDRSARAAGPREYLAASPRQGSRSVTIGTPAVRRGQRRCARLGGAQGCERGAPSLAPDGRQ